MIKNPKEIEELKTIQEASKAVQEAAKTSSKALDSMSAAGGFLKEVFGDFLQDSVGLVSDKLKFYRIERFFFMKEKVEKNLKDKGVEYTVPVPPKLGIPLIEAATIEDDEDLHTRWSNMLSNAINPNFNGKITRNFVSILKDMNPIDVLILDTIYKKWFLLPDDKKDGALFHKSEIITILRIEKKECEISLRNLLRLGCLKPGVLELKVIGLMTVSQSPSSYKDTELVGTTELGMEFYQSIK